MFAISQTLIYDGSMFAKPSAQGKNVEAAPVVIPVGSDSALVLQLRKRENFAVIPLFAAAQNTAWRFVVAESYLRTDSPLFVSTAVSVDAEANTISIPMNGSYTAEMQTALGTRPRGTFLAELQGFANADADYPSFCVSFPICFGNRRDDGTPTTPLDPGFEESDPVAREKMARALASVPQTAPQSMPELIAQVMALINGLNAQFPPVNEGAEE